MQKERQLVPKLRFPEFEGFWEENKLGNIASFFKGKGISKSDILEDGKNECIRYGELYTTYGEVINSIKSKTNISLDISVLSEVNDVIIPSSGETQLDIATASCVLKSGVILGGDLNIIKSKLNGVFLSYLLNNSKKKDIAKLAQGNSVVHLYNKQLETLKINLSQPKEQQKIADFLSAVDNRIQNLEKKKQLLEQYKKGITQKIFKQEIRFKDDNGKAFPEWENIKLGSLIKEYKKKSKIRDEFEVFTSSNKGLMFQSNYYGDNRLTDRDNTGFNIIPEGYITYRSRSDNRKFTFNLNSLGATGLISVYYPVFKSINGNSKFLIELLNFNQNYIGKYSVGTSQTVLSFNELAKIKFNIPCSEEQKKIANFLSAIDQRINLVTQQITQTKAYKKGLLQQMFV